MPEPEVIERARRDAEQGKSPSTQAGEFVHEEFEHVRQGKHGARSPQQAIAIGLSKARRAGVKLPLPKRGRTAKKTQAQARRDSAKGRRGGGPTSARRSRAVSGALRRESTRSASHSAISKQARTSARRRGRGDRRRAARAAVRTKGRQGLRRAARKASRTRTKTRRAGRSRRAGR